MIKSKDCAKFIGKLHRGDETDIDMISGLMQATQNKIKFVSFYSEENLEAIKGDKVNCIIASPEYEGKLQGPHIISDTPRLDFCKIANKFFRKNRESRVEPSATVSVTATIGSNVYIGHNVIIEDDVEIGENTVILHNVVVSERSHIGANCLVKSGSVIGQRGFGFERDLDGVPLSFPHYGAVLIGDFVEIGALNTIVAGALSDTVVANHVKTDDHVHIAHNVRVGFGALIAACVEISGSAVIGEKVWVGPNASMIDKIDIGDSAFVGLGAVVTRDVSKGTVVAGNPAKVLASKKVRLE